MKIATDEKEWEDGFCQYKCGNTEIIFWHIAVLPDLTDTDNAVLLERWEGTWSYLPTLKWVRISKDGTIKPSSFPPKGLSWFIKWQVRRYGCLAGVRDATKVPILNRTLSSVKPNKYWCQNSSATQVKPTYSLCQLLFSIMRSEAIPFTATILPPR